MNKQTKLTNIKQQLQQYGFETQKSLGSGAFGDVVLASKNSKLFAIKTIPKQAIQRRPELMKYVKNEYAVMQALQHPNIIRHELSLESEENFFMVLEYCNLGNLLKAQEKKPKKTFTVRETVLIGSDILKGLKQIHMNKFIHRDIKMENILLKDQNGKVVYKIADFGFARPIENNSVATHCGTSSFMAPEILTHKPYGISVDLWAFGVVMFFMLYAEYPFKSMNMVADIDNKCGKGFDLKKVVKKEKLEQYSDVLNDLFCRIFVVDPKKRITINQIFVHPLFEMELGGETKKHDSPKSTLESNSSEEDLLYCNQLKQLELQQQKVELLKYLHSKLSDSYKKALVNATPADILGAQFCLLRAMIFYTGKSLQAILSKTPASHFTLTGAKWKQFCEGATATKWINKLEYSLAEMMSQIKQNYILLKQINADIVNGWNLELADNDFDDLKISYRASIGTLFRLSHSVELPSLHKNQMKLLLICCHLINRVFEFKHMDTNFKNYSLKYKKFNHKAFVAWISEQAKDVLDAHISLLHKKYLNVK